MTHEDSLHAALAAGTADAETILANVTVNIRLLESVFRGTSSGIAHVKFGCSKALLLLSIKRPGLLCGKIDKIVELLDSENRILRWNAIAMVGNLAAVDRRNQVRGCLDKLFKFISGGELITANNAILALGKIGRAIPDKRGLIASQLIAVEGCRFPTAECRNIAVGKAILALEMFVDPGNAGASVVEFVRRQTGNTRAATARKAKAFLRKLSV